jgi:hypothetical protein
VSNKKSTIEPYWTSWVEVSVAPLYAPEKDLVGLDPEDTKAVFDVCGMPSVVLAHSPDDAFERAREKWPSARGWALLGLIDPNDHECIIEGSLTGIQRTVTELKG